MNQGSGRRLRLLILNDLAMSQLEVDLGQAAGTIGVLQAMKPPAHPYLRTRAEISARQGNLAEAAALMMELKGQANDHWRVSDQLRLESYQQQL